MSTAQPVQPPLLGNLIEICFVTPDHLQTILGLSKLGIGPFRVYRFNSTTVRDMTYRGQPASFELIVAFVEHGGLTYEIMQPVSGPSLMADYLESNGGKEGIQHIAFDMGGEKLKMEHRVRKMKERGFEPGMSGTWIGKIGTCEFVFFDTLGTTGTVFETIEFSKDWEDPEDGVWVPHAPGESTAQGSTRV